MDQLKEYIPLLIIALSFFFSFIGGKKKKKRNKEEVASEGFNDFEVPAYFEDTDPATEKKEKYNHNYNSIKREEYPFYVERSENLEKWSIIRKRSFRNK